MPDTQNIATIYQFVQWYFEPHDSDSNKLLASIEEGLEECHDITVVGADEKEKKIDAYRAGDKIATSIFTSRGFKFLNFTLYKQVGFDDIVEKRSFWARKPIDPFVVARRRRKRNTIDRLIRT